MKKKDIILILALVIGSVLYFGTQKTLESMTPSAVPAAAPTTRSSFADQGPTENSNKKTFNIESSIQRLITQMPKTQDLKKLGEQGLHHMPLDLASISEELGAIKEIVTNPASDAETIGKAIAFYRTCSGTTDWPTSVRALCLANLHEVAGESLDSAPVELYRLAKLAVEMPES